LFVCISDQLLSWSTYSSVKAEAQAYTRITNIYLFISGAALGDKAWNKALAAPAPLPAKLI